MKRNILIFGLISGLIITGMMLYTSIACYSNPDFQSGSMILGYAAMIIAFSTIFVGIRNFRNKYNGGTISFGKAFMIGLYITLIASTMYVVVWLIEYYFFIPDFIDKYTVHVLREAKSGGASQPELDKKVLEMANFREMYRNPLFVVLITYSEVLPVGLVVTLISALILKRKTPGPQAA